MQMLQDTNSARCTLYIGDTVECFLHRLYTDSLSDTTLLLSLLKAFNSVTA